MLASLANVLLHILPHPSRDPPSSRSPVANPGARPVCEINAPRGPLGLDASFRPYLGETAEVR
eukprot:5125496-Pyramimonas_sp.AAC.1